MKIAPANRDANRVLGTLYAALGGERAAIPPPVAAAPTRTTPTSRRRFSISSGRSTEPIAESDPNVRATLARLYVRSNAYDKAIPLLADLVNQEPGWQDGPLLLVEAYAGAGRNRDAIAGSKSGARRSASAADARRLLRARAALDGRGRDLRQSARERAAQRRAEHALCLGAAERGRPRQSSRRRATALSEWPRRARSDARALYLLSQAQRRLGDLEAAEAAARRVIAQNGTSPWGYYALAEALEARRQYQPVVDALAPAVAAFRGRSGDDTLELGMLLPHLGFAYQELGQYDKAIATFEEARKLSPTDPAVTGYLIQANIAAKKYAAAVDWRDTARAKHPDDLRLARLEAQALRPERQGRSGHGGARSGCRSSTPTTRPPTSRSRRLYADATRGAQAVKVLQDAQAKFPSDNASRSSSAPSSTSRSGSPTRKPRSARCSRRIPRTRRR